MSQQTSGLRFDIYERVHLPEDGAGIRELTSIELTPEITVERQSEQAVLKGHLFLSGTYTSEDESGEAEEQQLVHRIPVEITLPMNRIQDVNDISVEIENFDIDLLSTRSLNVTGVLSLTGIDLVTAAPADWQEEEEVVFTHRAQENYEAASPPWTAAPQAVGAADTFTFEAQPNIAEEEREEEETSSAAEQPEAAIVEPTEEPVAAADEPEEKKEIKIAFSGKSEEEAKVETFSGINTLISAASPEADRSDSAAVAAASAVVAAAAQPAEAQKNETEGKDRLEWKKLFLSNASDAPQFRRVRMCIAQKEDTIETIAERYKKNPRELQLYNRLNDQYLQEGQVVFIP